MLAARSFALLIAWTAILFGSDAAFAAAPASDVEFKTAQAEAKKTFQEKIVPFINTYCSECHGTKKQKGGTTFHTALKNPGAAAFHRQWKQSVAAVKAHEMPPDDAKKTPTEAEAQTFIDWVSNMKYMSPKDPGAFVIRRLNRVEYANTLRDLLGADPEWARGLPEEVLGAGYLNSLSPLLMEQYLTITNDVLSRVFAPEDAPPNALQKELFGDAPLDGANQRGAARNAVRAIARKAYRRPPSESELDVLMSVFDLAIENNRSYFSSLRLVLKAVLVSPQFLFITPAGEPEPGKEIVPVDDHQLASRLSYLLWATMPDRELSSLADQGRLRNHAVLGAQVKRLLSDPRSRALFDGFGAQWLGMDKLASKAFDTAKFPQMTKEMRTSMYDEARLLFEVIVRENRSILGFLDSDFTFLNETLAPLYGLEPEVHGPEMRRISLSNPNRGGILGMPGVLATTSFPDRTSPVNRGVWVLEQILGEHVPPAPPNVPSLDKQDKRKVANLSLRQRTELHRTNAVCANCHKILDPIGFGLENFDAIGRWREVDENGAAIDAHGELPGQNKFSSPSELKKIIVTRADDLSRNLAQKLLAYALCRQLEGYDEIVLDDISDTVTKDGYRIQTLITKVITSYPFTHRRVGELEGESNAKKLAN
jgi:mono/diheme cytochrome c family protein